MVANVLHDLLAATVAALLWSGCMGAEEHEPAAKLTYQPQNRVGVR